MSHCHFVSTSQHLHLYLSMILQIACSRLLVSEDDRKSERATSRISSERDPGGKGRRRETSTFSLPDPANRPTAFSIVRTDREPGTGYFTKLFWTESKIIFACTWINKSFLEYLLLCFTSDSIALWQVTVQWITHDHHTTIPQPLFEHVCPPPVVSTSFLEDIDLRNEHKKIWNHLGSAVALNRRSKLQPFWSP